ncbi:AAA family ATPase [Nostoc sp. CMAA1605]|uniref:AAA family ATPase n=1 Tax=Nostoc sp. CMAA1605 TaxID=2055159 RepID=UPI001F1C4426|nr:AAA family ATPase [Nostoc sp. CMAA1605]MCF4966113.1 serine/threonine protein kinase [Nostoc sp. CMAA1605]
MANETTKLLIPGYQIISQIYAGSRTRVYRAIRQQSQKSVVIKLLTSEYPNFHELLQFRNQYTISKNLHIPGIIQPLALETYGHGYILVMPDTGAIALREYIKYHRLSLVEFLRLAIQLSQILHNLHHNRVIHKDIKPANILIHPHSQQIELIDFSIASLLPKETLEIKSPNVLEGTLAYISPEQTGRMNRGIDYRSDFYSLGVTFYELLTGNLPFICDDPMELLHCHIAKPVHEIHNAAIPQVISDIVMKLMAKNAEDRYQSALGLKFDLEICLAQLQRTGEITDFEIGKRDICDRFLIPEKLYGRETEVKTLLQAFERVANGSTEMMLVAGFSGIGKTAVVNEVHKPITRQQGYFIKGKFDQFNRNLPLLAFVQALRDLIGQLLSESDSQLQQWRSDILAAVGDNGQVLIEVMPELERLIGQQPPAPELSGTAAQNRFNLLFQKFIAVFTTKDHPLVMFLDDLQWADSASLQLMKLLMADKNYLLLLGAYRDNEVYPTHPLMLTVDKLQRTGKIVSTITLAPLTLNDANQLVADTLHCVIERSLPLTELIFRKTRGNPFFITQFLKALHEDGQITFNRECGYWECDIAQIHALSLTDDVVEFMAQQLQKLPPETQNILKLAACIGNQFDLSTLAIVSEQLQADAAVALWKSLQEGLILPQSEVYKFYLSDEQVNINNHKGENLTYRFLHDRVQQAAYSLIPHAQKQATHLKIGELLLHNTIEQDLDNRIFDIVNQLNIGLELIDDLSSREKLAQLNLKAGNKAKVATAYSAAVSYLNTGLMLLTADSWQSQYTLTLRLYESLAESEYLNTNFENCKYLIEKTLESAQHSLDKIKVYEIQIQSYTAQNQLLEAINTGREALNLLGVDFPESCDFETMIAQHQQLKMMLGDRPIPSLVNLPILVDSHQAAAMRILVGLFASVYLAKPELLPLKIFTMVKICIQFGNSPQAAIAYSFYGLFLCATGEIERGYQFGELATIVLERLQAKELTSKVNLTFALFIKHWRDSIRSTLPVFLAGLTSGLEHGDLEYVGYCANCYCQFLFWTGENLETAEAEANKYCHLIENIKQEASLIWANTWRQTVINLRGNAENPMMLIGSSFNETVDLPALIASRNVNGICYVYLAKLLLSYLFGDAQTGKDYADKFEEYEQGAAGLLIVPLKNFYQSLSLLSLYKSVDTVTANAYLEKVKSNQKSMKTWADYAPMNYLHKFQLVEAEIYRVLGKKYEAGDFYDRAIAQAEGKNYLQEAALANELAAKFYLDSGKDRIAAVYMQEAYYGYAHWGAAAKTKELESLYPHLLRPIFQQSGSTFNPLETLAAITNANLSIHSSSTATPSSSTRINTVLDLSGILKASQSLSSTIELNELLHQLTQIILQNSGADRCALILPNSDGNWLLRAIATPENTELYNEPLENNPKLPIKLIQYVKNTKEVVVVDNLKTDLPVIGTYLTQRQPKSVLCLPILNQGNLIGILYLKNQSTSGVFTSDRVLILNFLCTQAAISLENARLYQQSQSYAQQLETSFQTLQTAQKKLLQEEKILQRQALALLQLSQSPAINQGNLSAAFVELTQVTANTLQTERVSVWLFNEHQTKIRCMDLFQRSAQEHSQGLELLVADYPTYFLAVKSQPIIAADDAMNDPRTCQFSKGYLDILNISSMLDSSFQINGDMGGVICCEHVGQKRTWTPSEQNFIRSVANLIALAIESHQRQDKAKKLNQALLDLKQSQLQIVQSEKMASLGNLVAGVAHEVNNPIGFLNGSISNARDYVKDILGHLGLYQKHYPQPTSEIQENAEDIDLEFVMADLPKLLGAMTGATERIKSISNSLRTFSRADTDHKVMANIHEGIDSTLLILKYRLKADEHRPAILIEQEYGDLPLIECFPGQLNQVFMNILANAIDMFDDVAQKYTFEELENQPHKIIIRTRVIGNQVDIHIQDNGEGMSADVKDRIFDHLFTTKGVGKGTGLGLAIARQIVEEKHGGKIKVNSVLGEGTEFIISLPNDGKIAHIGSS